MASGINPFPFPGDPGMNRRGGEHAGPLFPEWGDPNGQYGKLVLLKMEAVQGSLPKAPFLLRKSVEAHLGTKIHGAHPEARGMSYVLQVRNAAQVEKLKRMTQLSNGFAIKIAEHPVLNYSKCVISCHDACEYSEQELVSELKPQGVKEVRRITRREGDKRINTPTIILTIEGTVIPEEVNIGWIRCRTRNYYPSPMLCYCCWEFGHTRARCQQQDQPTCGHCSDKHTSSFENPCIFDAYCSRCKTNSHPLSSQKCPTYAKEEEIQHLRVDLGISYPAAKRQYELRNNPRSMAATVKAGYDQELADIKAQLASVLEANRKMNEEVAKLAVIVKEQNAEIAKKQARIERLEAASRLPLEQRLGVVTENGTIQDLVAKNRRLEAALAAKDREIETLRAVDATQKSSKNTVSPKETGTIPKETQPTQKKKKKTKSKLEKTNSTDSDETTNKRLRNCPSPISDNDVGMQETPSQKEVVGTDIEISSTDEGMSEE